MNHPIAANPRQSESHSPQHDFFSSPVRRMTQIAANPRNPQKLWRSRNLLPFGIVFLCFLCDGTATVKFRLLLACLEPPMDELRRCVDELQIDFFSSLPAHLWKQRLTHGD